MYFKDIPGHTDLKAYVSKIVAENRVPHAILLVGGEGYGKLALALALAAYLQCTDRKDGDACGTCSNCKKTQQLIHPDIHFSFPVVTKGKLKRADTTSQHFLPEWRSFVLSKPYGDLNEWLQHIGATDKRANINVAECNQILKNLSLVTYEGGYKIQIVWYADLLGKEGNRILKLVEEPSDDTIIILISHNRNAILNTLRSRCQIISVPPVDDTALLEHINVQFDLSPEDKQELAFLSAGNIRKAYLLGHNTEMNYSEDLFEWLRTAYKGDPELIVTQVDAYAGQGRQELINFLEYGLHFLREYLLLLNSGDQNILKLTETEKEVALKMGKILDVNKTEGLKNLFETAIGYVHRNLSLKSLIMHITLEINAILRSEVDNLVT